MSQFYVDNNASGSATVDFLQGNTGGAVGPNGANTISVVGSGAVSIAGNPGAHTLTVSLSGGSFNWNVVTSATNPNVMTAQNGYVPNDNVSLVNLTLPSTAAVGDSLRIIGNGSAGWRILQPAGASIHLQSSTTTVGVGGSLSSTDRYDTVELICIVANTQWTCATVTGNLTVV